MSYIGNPIISTDFPKDTFSGNGSTTAFTMSIAPASVNAVIVVVSGITQDPSTYTISGTTLTFSAAPPTGTSNISVRHLGVAGTPQVPALASVTSASIAAQDLAINGVTVGKGASSVSTNCVLGYQAGQAVTSGGQLVAIGYQSAYSNTTGGDNVAIGGYQALYSNTTGSQNIAIGRSALSANTTANNNTAVGYQAGYNVTTGVQNTCIGNQAGRGLTVGNTNTFIGAQAGYSIANGSDSRNTFIGSNAGYSVTTGNNNTFIGGSTTGSSSGSGYAMTTGSNNTILGTFTGNQGGLDIRTLSNYIVLSDGAGEPRLHFTSAGSLLVPTVYSITTGSAANVFVGSNGHIHRSTSSLKYKTDVQNATHGLAEVLQLRPVTYKGKNDGELVFGGLIAEEVADAGLTEFVQYADDGTPDALAYGNMVSLCIKAIQELNAQVEAQALEIATLKANP